MKPTVNQDTVSEIDPGTIALVNEHLPTADSLRAISAEQVARDLFHASIRDLQNRRNAGPSIRVQLNSEFNLLDAVRQVPYWHELGVRKLYLSPIFKAVPQDDVLKEHGYDVIDHSHINPMLGGAKVLPGEKSPEWRGELAFRELLQTLRRFGMTCELDHVPNHMGVGDRADGNRPWQSILKYGRKSPCTRYAYIDFNKTKGRVVTPTIGDPLHKTIQDGHFELSFNDGVGDFFIRLYHHTKYPVTPASYPQIIAPRGLAALVESYRKLDSALDRSLAGIADDTPSYLQTALDSSQDIKIVNDILLSCQELEHCSFSGNPGDQTYLPWRVFQIEKALQELYRHSSSFKRYLDQNIAEVNGENGLPRTAMQDLLDAQVYAFKHWKMGTGNLNVSRFFDVNTLWALREEDPYVFQAVHAGLFRLIATFPEITAVRIDHPDGLFDPSDYLHSFQRSLFLKLARQHFREIPEIERRELNLKWLDVAPHIRHLWETSADVPMLPVHLEKILGEDETPPDFADQLKRRPHSGTTGYEYLCELRSVMIDPKGFEQGIEVYRDFTGEHLDFQSAHKAAKQMIVSLCMHDEFDLLGNLFIDTFLSDEQGKPLPQYADISKDVIKTALETLAVELPVYRLYINKNGRTDTDNRYLHSAIEAAIARRDLPPEAFRILAEFFDTESPTLTDEQRTSRLSFVQRWQKFTGPVEAKAREDTLWYRAFQFNMALLEVGGHPEKGPASPDSLHSLALAYAKHFPLTMIAGSTHDTKKDEGTASRFIAMSYNMRGFSGFLQLIDFQAGQLKNIFNAKFKNSAKVQYLIYTTIAATMPKNFSNLSKDLRGQYVHDISGYIRKALLEGKEEVSYISEDAARLSEVSQFVEKLLSDEHCVQAFELYVAQLSPQAARVSLAQLVLRLGGLPGVPDIYQGTEIHTLKLVDPHNRQAVDYRYRRDLLKECVRNSTDAAQYEKFTEFMRQNPDADITKMYITWRGLKNYNDHIELFRNGAYVPLTPQKLDGIAGEPAKENFAFMRSDARSVVITSARLRDGNVSCEGKFILLEANFEGAIFRNIYTGKELIAQRNEKGVVALSLTEIYDGFPAATLVRCN